MFGNVQAQRIDADVTDTRTDSPFISAASVRIRWVFYFQKENIFPSMSKAKLDFTSSIQSFSAELSSVSQNLCGKIFLLHAHI
jgi:hypothetical protein